MDRQSNFNLVNLLSIRAFVVQSLLLCVTLVMCESIPAASIPPGKPRSFVARWVPEAEHLTVNSVPALRAIANNKKPVS